MRMIFFVIIQFFLIGVFLLIAYLPTIGMDIFPWGDARYSEEFKMGLIILFPISILIIAFKFILNRKILNQWYFKYSWACYLILLLMSSFTLLIAQDDLTYWTVIGISLIAVLILLIEACILIKRASSTNI